MSQSIKNKIELVSEVSIDSVEVSFTKETVTFEDKTGAKSTWSAFDFPDGSKGAIIITKIPRPSDKNGFAWTPVKDIKKIAIEFQ